MKRLKVALMGLSGVGAEYLATIESCEELHLTAVADTDPKLLQRHAESSGVRTYEDYRSLVVETARAGVDLLVVALQPFESIEYVEMAATQGIAVFHKAPFARHTREAQRLVRRFAEHRCPLVVSRTCQLEPAFAPLRDLCQGNEHVHAATAEVKTTDSSAGWRGDATRAGGGVLLNGAYEVVDLLVAVFGMPETVYAQCANAGAPGTPRKYDTEDVAIMSLSFSKERIACVTAMRNAAESAWHVTLLGATQTLELAGDHLTVTDREGGLTERHTVWTKHQAVHALRAFAEAGADNDPVASSRAEEHLPTMAVIEAAYLSAKTGERESPGRLLG